MPGKSRYIRSIDLPKLGVFDAGPDEASTLDNEPPSQSSIGPPTNLVLSTAIERNAVTPTSNIGATWYPPAGVAPSGYIIQWSTSNTFPVASTPGQASDDEATTIQGLIPSTLYYVRVAAIAGNQTSDWSATVSTTTAADTTAPNPVTAQASTFINGGDLVVTWTNPTSANFRDVEIVIYASNGGATLQTIFDATGRYVWNVRQNLQATSNVGDPTLYITLRARSWGGIFSTSVNTSATKSAPSAPTVTLSGFSQLATASITSAAESVYSLFEYVWKRDGSTQRTVETADRQNIYETGAAGDEGTHSWTVVVRQKDAFGQYSSTTTSSAVILDTLTIAYLRAGLIYTDSLSNTVATLAVLKDGNLVSSGVSYAA